MILYHGSNKHFKEFNRVNRGSNRTASGFNTSGIFLTDDINFAKQYGDIIYTVEVDDASLKLYDCDGANFRTLEQDFIPALTSTLESALEEGYTGWGLLNLIDQGTIFDNRRKMVNANQYIIFDELSIDIISISI